MQILCGKLLLFSEYAQCCVPLVENPKADAHLIGVFSLRARAIFPSDVVFFTVTSVTSLEKSGHLG